MDILYIWTANTSFRGSTNFSSVEGMKAIEEELHQTAGIFSEV